MLALGLLGHVTGDAAMPVPLGATRRRVADAWLRDALPHAPVTSYPFYDAPLTAMLESVPWLSAVTLGAADGWQAFEHVAAQTGAQEAVARKVYAAVASRAFSMPMHNEAGTAGGTAEAVVGEHVIPGHVVAVVPLLDMVNHAAEPNVVPVCDEARCWLEALRPLAAGEEVLSSYGELPDMALLLRYGFTLGVGRNPAGVRLNTDACSVRITGVGSESGGREMAQEWRDMEGFNCLKRTLGEADAAPWLHEQCLRMLRELRAASWDASLIARAAQDPATRLLHRTWAELESGLLICAEETASTL